jgi:hypothetical protein
MTALRGQHAAPSTHLARSLSLSSFV